MYSLTFFAFFLHCSTVVCNPAIVAIPKKPFYLLTVSIKWTSTNPKQQPLSRSGQVNRRRSTSQQRRRCRYIRCIHHHSNCGNTSRKESVTSKTKY